MDERSSRWPFKPEITGSNPVGSKWALGRMERHLLDTQETTGSIPVVPTVMGCRERVACTTWRDP